MTRRELPNGWAYGISVGVWTDPDGRSYEGIGFPPDVVVKNQPEELEQGIDSALETAISLLE